MSTNNIEHTIPPVSLTKDPEIRSVLEAMKTNIETLYNEDNRDTLKSAVLRGELIELGILPPEIDSALISQPKPTGLSVSGSGTSVRLIWDASTSSTHKLTEIFISSTNVRSNATLIATSTGDSENIVISSSFGNSVFFWIRFQGTQGSPGQFSSGETAGVSYKTSGIGNSNVISVIFDAAAGIAIGTTLLDAKIPNNSYITRAWYDVITTFTSTTDAGTIGIGVTTDDTNGIVAVIAISAGGNPWDAGAHEGIQDGTVATYSVKSTAERTIEAVVAVEALTAGRLILFLEFSSSE